MEVCLLLGGKHTAASHICSTGVLDATQCCMGHSW
jgi:hypothetical protein